MELEVRDATVRATDRAGNVVEIATVGWDRPAPERRIPFAFDAAITGRATRLSFEGSGVSVGILDPDAGIVDRYQLDADERVEFEAPGVGGVLVWSAGRINTWIRFDGAGVVRKEGDTNVVVELPHPTPVTLAFQGSAEVPSHTVTVPRTPEGVATALTQLSAAYTETAPIRTSPLSRGHPPRIVFGDRTEIPEQVDNAAGVSDVELHLPPTLEALLPAASLAAYLGAEVSVDPDGPPRLASPRNGLSHEFSGPPAFQYDAAATLQRMFWLDMLVRWETEDEEDWLEADALAALDIDPERCVELSMADRVERYLATDFGTVAPLFPEWTANAYAEPTHESVLALPYLVRHLTQVYLTDARPDRAGTADPGDTGTTDPVWDRPRARATHDPTDRPSHGPRPRVRGPYVGWLGEDPLDGAYQVTLPALRHREKYLGEHEEITVALVCADPDRARERDRLVELYDLETPPVEVTVYDRPTREELAAVVAGGTDLLHYLGNCEDGLTCADGVLAPAEFPESNVRTFFLDGPRSRRAGLEMLSAGSLAGAVWDGDPGPAAESLRRTFLRGLLGGLTADVAGRYARHLSDGDTLAVVGDGLHMLVMFQWLGLFPMEVTPVGDGQYRVGIPTWYTDVGTGFGGLCLERWQFGGNQFDLTLSAADVVQLLDTRRYVVVYEGELYLPEEVTPFDPTV